MTARARFAGPPAVDSEGKTIAHSARWGYSPHVFRNSEVYSAIFMAVVMGAFIAFNTSQTAYDMYERLDRAYTPFQISALGTFIVSTIVYYVGAALFAFIDLTGRPRFLFKYKVQPFQRVNGREYWDITKIVIRNQLFVVLPLVLIKGYLKPSKTHPRDLEGPWATLANLLFNVVSVCISHSS